MKYRLITAITGFQRRSLPCSKNKTWKDKRELAAVTFPPPRTTGYLVKGNIILTIGTDLFNVKPGDSWMIPGGVEHKADIIKDSVAIEVFSPIREDYLPMKQKIND